MASLSEGDEAREPAGRDDAARAELLADPLDHGVDQARVAVHHAGLHRGGRVAPDHGAAARSRRGEPRGALEQRLERDLSRPGKITPPRTRPAQTQSKVVAVPKSTAITVAAEHLVRRDRVHDPVGADLARVVDADRHPRADARADDQRRAWKSFCETRSKIGSSGGTTQEMIASETSLVARLACVNRP